MKRILASAFAVIGVSAVGITPIAVPAVTFAQETYGTEGDSSMEGDSADDVTDASDTGETEAGVSLQDEYKTEDQTDHGGTGAANTVNNAAGTTSVGTQKNGWVYENGWYFYKNGSRYTGWRWMTSAEGEKKAHWSFFGEDGRLRSGWVRFGKETSNPDGNNPAHWSYFGDNGWLRTGWVQLGKGTSEPDGNSAKHWSYFGDNGWLRSGWVRLGKGTSEPDGNNPAHWSYFGDDGWLRTNWVQLGAGTSEPDGNSAKHWSYFGDNGWLRTGWQDMGSGTGNPDGNSEKHRSFFGDNGWLRTGLQKIGGNTYSFGQRGWLMDQDQVMLNKAQDYSSNTSYLILVDRGRCKTAIFKGSYGNWNYDKYWSCSVGKPSTPTITGTYSLGYKQLYFDPEDGGRCWYKTQIYGSYLFHSVIYYRDSAPNRILDGTIGAQVSHGCVRLDIQNAKYIYDTVPSGTKVVIYN